jgi:hypothetical protein
MGRGRMLARDAYALVSVADACGRCNAFDSLGQHTRTVKDHEADGAACLRQRPRCVW